MSRPKLNPLNMKHGVSSRAGDLSVVQTPTEWDKKMLITLCEASWPQPESQNTQTRLNTSYSHTFPQAARIEEEKQNKGESMTAADTF